MSGFVENVMQLGSGELLYVRIMEKISDYIKENDLRIGEKIPSERELSTMLCVSRNSVREAIRELEVQGILSVQPGRGTFIVGEVTDRAMLIKLKKQNFFELFEVKTVLERYVIMKLAANMEDGCLKELEEIAKKMIALSEAGIFPQSLDDLFHEKILAVYQNKQLIEIIHQMKEIFAKYNAAYFNTGFGLINEKNQSIFDTIPLHLRMIEGMKERNVEKTVAAYDEIVRIDVSIYSLVHE